MRQVGVDSACNDAAVHCVLCAAGFDAPPYDMLAAHSKLWSKSHRSRPLRCPNCVISPSGGAGEASTPQRNGNGNGVGGEAMVLGSQRRKGTMARTIIQEGAAGELLHRAAQVWTIQQFFVRTPARAWSPTPRQVSMRSKALTPRDVSRVPRLEAVKSDLG